MLNTLYTEETLRQEITLTAAFRYKIVKNVKFDLGFWILILKF